MVIVLRRAGAIIISLSMHANARSEITMAEHRRPTTIMGVRNDEPLEARRRRRGIIPPPEAVTTAGCPRRRRLRHGRAGRSTTSTTTTTAAAFLALLVLVSSSSPPEEEEGEGIDLDRRRRPRREEGRTRETIDRWRSLLSSSSSSSSSSSGFDMTGLRPLDLVLDDDHCREADDDDDCHYRTGVENERRPTPRAYQRGDGGFLEPYDFVNYQKGEGEMGTWGGGSSSIAKMTGFGIDDDEGVVDDHRHWTRGRLGLYNLEPRRGNGIDDDDDDDDDEEDEGRRMLDDHRSGGGGGGLRGSAPDASDVASLADDFASDDGNVHHGKRSSSHGEHFASSSSSTSSSWSKQDEQMKPRNENDGAPPVTFPPVGTVVGRRQTFGVLVSDEGSSRVRRACVQFKDAAGKRSPCLPLTNVGDSSAASFAGRQGGDEAQDDARSGIWERTFDEFGSFAGVTLKYRVQIFDDKNKRVVTRWKDFTIDAMAAELTTTATTTTTTTAATTTTVGTTTSTTTSSRETTKLLTEIKDDNWPHGGVVQQSTGRILFFFDGNPYVCSGTVIKDTASDRTIVLTAGHCAYQYQPGGGRFTEHAMFIPNQVDTRGLVSDELCSNDPLGCWVPAFAVVHYEWTIKGFPHSVPWDYAYYVIQNDPAAHKGGFIHEGQPELSRILEEIVEPLPIDFDWQVRESAAMHPDLPFIHGLGYAFNRDPAFRYCADNAGTRFGISTYENLWMDGCTMTGGSSGGPWLTDTDSDGRGTVISLNSWGYATITGMAGPDFSTASGSKAECLFEAAKNTPFNEVVGERGIVVYNC